MRTTQQVAIYCAFREREKIFYILLKRIPERGGFWQPITGGMEDFDEKDLFTAVIREVQEELGIRIDRDKIIKIDHQFSFIDKKEGLLRNEQCFGVLIDATKKNQIYLSPEHDSIIFSTDIEYLKSLMKYEENRTGLDKFSQLLTKDGKNKKIDNQTT